LWRFEQFRPPSRYDVLEVGAVIEGIGVCVQPDGQSEHRCHVLGDGIIDVACHAEIEAAAAPGIPLAQEKVCAVAALPFIALRMRDQAFEHGAFGFSQHGSVPSSAVKKRRSGSSFGRQRGLGGF
jgi:hypothetical protein